MEHFTFYAHWAKAVEGKDAEYRLAYYESIFAQAFYGKPIEYNTDMALMFISKELSRQEKEQETQKKRSAAAKKSAAERWNKRVLGKPSGKSDANAYPEVMRTHTQKVCERIPESDANASNSEVIHRVIHKVIHKDGKSDANASEKVKSDANASEKVMRTHQEKVCERIPFLTEPQETATMPQRSATNGEPSPVRTVPDVCTPINNINNNNNNKGTYFTVREHDTCKGDGKAREQRACASFPFFDKWWAAFPDTIDKTERNRVIAMNVWRTTRAESHGEQVLEALRLSAIRWDNPRYIPLPQNWLIKMPWTANLENARVRAETAEIPKEPDESELDIDLAIERLISGKRAGIWNEYNEERLKELNEKKAVWKTIRAMKNRKRAQ